MKRSLLLGATVLLAACNAPAPTTAPGELPPPAAEAPAAGPPADSMPADTSTPPKPAAPAPSATTTSPAFADKVWKVSASSAVEVGSTYTFLSDGTLVIDSPNGTPLYGAWKVENGLMTMTEEGQSYATDIVKQDAGTFQIRSHNPGGVVDITLVPAPEVPLPAAPKR